MTLDELEGVTKKIRTHAINMVHWGSSAHIATALSCVDMMAVLYFEIMNVDPTNPWSPDRDRFILSKGHGCAAQYAVLAERGFFDKEKLKTYYQNDGLLGHATYKMVPGMETSTGSLGHGLGLGIGMAYAAKLDNKDYKAFVLMGDGECNEGSVWEGALAAAQWKLDNLVVLIDYNKIQGCGSTDEIMQLDPFKEKWEAFGWAVHEIDGHDLGALNDTLGKTPFEASKPSVVICHTTKGKGVSFMENTVEWHYKSPNPEQYKQALEELNT